MGPDDEKRSSEIPEEPETKPDLFVFPCPACTDESGKPTGYVLVTKIRHKGREERCPTCQGLRQLNREQLARYRHEQSRAR